MITLNASLGKVTFHAADTAVRNCAGFLMHSLSTEISVEVTSSSRLPCLGAVLSMGCITSVFNNTYLSCKKYTVVKLQVRYGHSKQWGVS